MFFSNFTYFKLLDIYKINRKAANVVCKGRNWSTIAFRISGKSVFKSYSKNFIADEASIIYVPAKVDFSRISTDEEMFIVHIDTFENNGNTIEVLNSDNTFLFNEFNNMYDEWRNKNPGYEHRCTAILHMILANLKSNNKNNLSPYKYLLIKPGVELIESNFDNPSLNIKQISEICNISPEYFRKLYKEKFGISPLKAIIQKRIEKSCRLLQSGHFTIAEVSKLCGFEDCKYFSTLFHKVIKISPREYRANYNN